jgi:uncharacterized protein DUF3710
VFRRRKSDSADLNRNEDEGELTPDFDDETVAEGPGPQSQSDAGPWDATESFPERDRVDLGSLWVPVGADFEIQLVMHEQNGAWVTARHGESELQMQAFAASRSDSLWDDVRAEISAEVQAAGGSTQEADGAFGIALIAQVPAEPGRPETGMRTVRFVGADGPRWFLRGLFGGPAAAAATADGQAEAEVLEDVFRNVVVSRGEHPVPPRDLLQLRLPPDAQQALDAQAAAAAEEEQEQNSRFTPDLNPFERGPEFTETR